MGFDKYVYLHDQYPTLLVLVYLLIFLNKCLQKVIVLVSMHSPRLILSVFSLLYVGLLCLLKRIKPSYKTSDCQITHFFYH
jgi:hypothetical protein